VVFELRSSHTAVRHVTARSLRPLDAIFNPNTIKKKTPTGNYPNALFSTVVLSSVYVGPGHLLFKVAPTWGGPLKEIPTGLAEVYNNCIGLPIHCNHHFGNYSSFLEYLRHFLIDFNQIYRHSSVPKTTSLCIF